MTKDFSQIDKEQMNVQVPVDLSTKIRERAARKRWSIARAMTEAAAIGLGIDPAEYGIEADTRQPA